MGGAPSHLPHRRHPRRRVEEQGQEGDCCHPSRRVSHKDKDQPGSSRCFYRWQGIHAKGSCPRKHSVSHGAPDGPGQEMLRWHRDPTGSVGMTLSHRQ